MPGSPTITTALPWSGAASMSAVSRSSWWPRPMRECTGMVGSPRCEVFVRFCRPSIDLPGARPTPDPQSID